jgi:uncharacterized protein (DUF1499 family)
MTTSAAPSLTGPRGLPLVAAFGSGLALLGSLVLAGSGFGYRGGIWPLGIAFRLLGIGAWIALVGGIFSVLAAAVTRPGSRRRGFTLSVLGILLGLGGFGVMAAWRVIGRSAPPIHDITTDLTDPPAFVAILPLRADASNPPQYGGPEVAAQQRAGYPDIGPADLPIPPGTAFRLGLAAARNMGWEIVAADSTSGRIEATATTRWFGFKDDIVVRVSATEHGSRVDVRSVSRVGRGDVGTNARRVRRYITQLQRTV